LGAADPVSRPYLETAEVIADVLLRTSGLLALEIEKSAQAGVPVLLKPAALVRVHGPDWVPLIRYRGHTWKLQKYAAFVLGHNAVPVAGYPPCTEPREILRLRSGASRRRDAKENAAATPLRMTASQAFRPFNSGSTFSKA
jgi:hypothetical protein